MVKKPISDFKNEDGTLTFPTVQTPTVNLSYQFAGEQQRGTSTEVTKRRAYKTHLCVSTDRVKASDAQYNFQFDYSRSSQPHMGVWKENFKRL